MVVTVSKRHAPPHDTHAQKSLFINPEKAKTPHYILYLYAEYKYDEKFSNHPTVSSV